MAYAIMSRDFEPELTGRVNTAVNVLAFLTAFLLQAGIGAIIDLFSTDSGVRAPQGHRVALMTVVALQTLALVWTVWVWRRR